MDFNTLQESWIKQTLHVPDENKSTRQCNATMGKRTKKGG